MAHDQTSLDPAVFVARTPPAARRGPGRPRLFSITLLYSGGVALGVTLFVLAFLAGGFSFIDILFYRGIVVVAAVAVLHGALLGICLPWTRRHDLSRANLVCVVALSAMVNLTFFTLVPVNLDRSISVFLLAWLDDSAAQPLTRADLQAVFERVYVGRYHAIDRRIGEQIASGNIRSTAGGYVLTPRGRAFNAFARAVGSIFSVDPRFLDPHREVGAMARGQAACAKCGGTSVND